MPHTPTLRAVSSSVRSPLHDTPLPAPLAPRDGGAERAGASPELRAALDEIVLHPETGRIKWDRLLNLVGSGASSPPNHRLLWPGSPRRVGPRRRGRAQGRRGRGARGGVGRGRRRRRRRPGGGGERGACPRPRRVPPLRGPRPRPRPRGWSPAGLRSRGGPGDGRAAAGGAQVRGRDGRGRGRGRRLPPGSPAPRRRATAPLRHCATAPLRHCAAAPPANSLR